MCFLSIESVACVGGHRKRSLMRCDVNAEVLTATQTQAVCDVKDIFLQHFYSKIDLQIYVGWMRSLSWKLRSTGYFQFN